MTSVIIPTSKGGLNHLTRLMPILTKEPDIEIIIVNNNSRDGTINYLSQYPVRIINNTIPANFSESNNMGVEIARYENILFLNNDTVPKPGFIKEMKKHIGEWNIVGILIFTMDNPKRIQHIGVNFTSDYVPYELGLPVPEISPGVLAGDPRVRGEREVPSVTACCMMSTKTLHNKLGGFDEQYVNGWEDTDYCLRARELGSKIFYTGKSYIFHKGSGSIGRFAREVENRIRYDQIWVDTGRAKAVLKGFRQT